MVLEGGQGAEGGFTDRSLRYGILCRISALKGEADAVSLREGSIRSPGVIVVDTPAVREHGRFEEGDVEGIEKEERLVITNSLDKTQGNNQTRSRKMRRGWEQRLFVMDLLYINGLHTLQ